MPFPRAARAAQSRRERDWELAWLESPTMEHPGHRAWGLWVPVALSLLVQVPSAFISFPGSPARDVSTIIIALVLAIAGPLALIAARRFPGPVVAVVSIAATADLLVADDGIRPPYVALGFAIVGAIVRDARVWAWISVAVCWGAALVVSIVSGVQISPGRIAAITLGVLILMGVGEAVRTRRDQLEQMRHTIADRRRGEVEAERVRIARELHDVLAHSLSQINVQAGVGLHLMASQPERAADALASIKSTSKIALDEVRTVLGILRADADAEFAPEPDLARLDGLVESMAALGLTVTLDSTLSSDPPAAVQLAIYRIVQESLTNAVRHSGSDNAMVTISQIRSDYVITIRDGGIGGLSSPGSGSGRGLLGMRERAELFGGTLHTSSTPGEGFTVRAVIPSATRGRSSSMRRSGSSAPSAAAP